MWRLARALTDEGHSVRLIIDELETLTQLTGGLKNGATLKKRYGIDVFQWESAWDEGSCPMEPASFVIEGFG